MTLWYIDPTITNGQESDSFVGQYGTGKLRNSWADVVWAAGDSWYQRADSEFVGAVGFGAGGISASVRSVMGMYGSGAKPIIRPTGSTRAITLGGTPARSYVTIQDYTIYGGNSGANRRCIGAGSTADPCLGLQLSRLTCRDVASDGSTDCNAIFVEGDDLVVEDCDISEIADDAIWNTGRNARVVRNRIKRVGISGRTAGDCIQLVGRSGDAGSFYVAWNDCDHSDNNQKQGIIVSGAASGSGGTVEHNTVVGPANVGGAYVGILVDQPNANIRRNVTRGGTYGIMVQSPQTVEANIIIASGIGLIFEDLGAGSNNAVARHNLIIGTADYAIYGNGTTGTGASARNNLVVNCAKGSLMKSGMTRSHNLFWNTAQIDDGGAGAGTNNVLADPLLLDPARPWLGLRADSPCWGAGVLTSAGADYFGKEWRELNIGPFQRYAARALAERALVARSVTTRSARTKMAIAP